MSRLSLAACMAVPAALMLAACQPATNNDPVLNRPDRDACGAAAYSNRVGKDHTAYDFSAPNRPVRVLGPNTPMTMDHRTERLNVDIDTQGRITRIWCG
ncbi:I78 family peptidase inhibitor [Roseovarius dicentrarchi]|uniref:I78 family peptidase inhibitor n=1 Tax=Roseovarius dicentrarchi TaxID=2250573 RepID=UPI001EF13E4C|nr:I78 family peptidase inhibitor [Roseovarius dicentrarchi]